MKIGKIAVFAIFGFSTLLVLSSFAFAQSATLQGIIDGRSGANMMVKSADGTTTVVVLNDGTQVEEVEGGLHMRKKQMGLTALVPGLPVEVKGSYNDKNQMLADSVKFKASEFKNAQDIQAGIAPAEAQVQAQQQQLQQTEQQVQQQQAAVQAQQAELTAEQRKIAANKAAIAAANKRFGELGDYNILGETTVYFGNGKITVDPQYQTALVQLAQQAKGVTAYILQVQGYASAVGSAALNQRLSSERANAVTAILEQQGGIPLTNMLAPGAMGTSSQVDSDATAEGQAENRRVVVRILQNKGVSGT